MTAPVRVWCSPCQDWIALGTACAHVGVDGRPLPSLLAQEARDRREPEVTALRQEVARLTASCEHMRAVIAFARRQTSLQDCLRALDGA